MHGIGGIVLALAFIKGTSELTATSWALTDLLQLQSAQSGPERFALHWADALWIAAGIYVAFAMRQKKKSVVYKELGGVVLYGIPAALARARVGPGVAFWAGVGWLLHPLWDVAHEHERDDESKHYVPHFYPMLCMTFDVVMSSYLLRMWWLQGV